MARNKLINCKTCGAEIAATAKRCPHCGAKNNNNPPFVVRLALALIVVIIAASMAGALFSDSDRGNSNGTNTAPGITKPSNEVSTSVILDDSNVKVTYLGVSKAVGIEGFYLKLKVENKANSEIWVYLDKASVNDEMVSLVMSAVPMYIQPGKSSSNPFILPMANSSIKEVNDIETVSFKVVVENNKTNKKIETSSMLTINVK